jgi:Protein of unknown function (DUF4231)
MSETKTEEETKKLDFHKIIDRLDLEEIDKDYLKYRWLDQMQWMSRKSAFMQTRHKRWRWATIFSAALLPVLISINFAENKTYAQYIRFGMALLGAVPAIAVAAEELNQYGKNWYNYRNAAELLKTQGWQFIQLAGTYKNAGDHRQAFKDFSEQVESIVSNDVKVFVADGLKNTFKIPTTNVAEPPKLPES